MVLTRLPTPLCAEAENSRHSSVDWSVDDDEEAFVRVRINNQSNPASSSNPPSESDNAGLL